MIIFSDKYTMRKYPTSPEHRKILLSNFRTYNLNPEIRLVRLMRMGESHLRMCTPILLSEKYVYPHSCLQPPHLQASIMESKYNLNGHNKYLLHCHSFQI
ncbi:hypothetical protein V6Z12_D05G351300 [Gossypium hirsutum]